MMFAVILGTPAIIQGACKGIQWIYKKITGNFEANAPHACWLSDAKVRLMVLFNEISSRPVLHMSNSFCKKLVAAL